MMYSAVVQELFERPTRVGPLDNATHKGVNVRATPNASGGGRVSAFGDGLRHSAHEPAAEGPTAFIGVVTTT